MQDRMARSLANAAEAGAIQKVSTRGRTVSVRFGIQEILWPEYEPGTWMTVRRVYENQHYNGPKELIEEAKKNGYGRVKIWTTGLTGTTDRFCSRTRSQANLEAAARSMCQGQWGCGGRSYVEVLPWREDKDYPSPRPVAEVLEELSRGQ